MWQTTIDPSFWGARSNLESSGAAEPHSLILNQATASPKPALLSSPKVSRCVRVPFWLYVFVYVCLRRQRTKPKTPLLLARVKVG